MVKRKRNYRRRVFSGSKVYSYVRKTYTENVLTTGAAQGGAFSFSLNDLPNVTEFTTLYDRYKIKKIVLKLIPKVSQTVTQSPGSMSIVANSRGHLFSAIDYDDVAVPPAVDTLLQYPNCKRTPTDRIHTRIIYPCIRSVLYNVADSSSLGFSTAFSPQRRWIDCTMPKVQHYGLKWWLTQTNGIEVSYDIETTVYIQFKNVR